MERHNRAPDQQPQRPDPEHGRSATQMGFFMVPVFLFGVVVFIGIGYTFRSLPDQSDVFAYISFALAAVLLFFAVRKIRRLATGKDKY